MTPTEPTIGAHADMRPGDYRFTRHMTLPGELQHTRPLRPWLTDLGHLAVLLALGVAALFWLPRFVVGFWSMYETVQGWWPW